MQRQLGHLLSDMGVRRQSEMDELRGPIDRLEGPDRDWGNSRRSAEVDWVGLTIAPHIPSIPRRSNNTYKTYAWGAKNPVSESILIAKVTIFGRNRVFCVSPNLIKT
ncbi:MAG: hypothetical protein WBL95_23940 [Microcoleus sp.]